jgi:hypothetical protein
MSKQLSGSDDHLQKVDAPLGVTEGKDVKTGAEIGEEKDATRLQALEVLAAPRHRLDAAKKKELMAMAEDIKSSIKKLRTDARLQQMLSGLNMAAMLATGGFGIAGSFLSQRLAKNDEAAAHEKLSADLHRFFGILEGAGVPVSDLLHVPQSLRKPGSGTLVAYLLPVVRVLNRSKDIGQLSKTSEAIDTLVQRMDTIESYIDGHAETKPAAGGQTQNANEALAA